MPHLREIILAGLVGEVKEYHTYKYQSKNEQRREKREVSPAEMALINEYNAARKLRILLNANFKADDSYLTLTYQGTLPDVEQAKKYFKKFNRKLRDFYKKLGISLKYIGTTEFKGKRIHHHLLINAADGVKKSRLQKFWEHGFVKKEDFGGLPDDCERLADYFIKESNNTFNTESRVHGLRWISSKNLVHPEAEKKIIKADSWKEEPKPKKGYYIDKASIKEWVTRDGYHCRFYRMIKFKKEEDNEELERHTPKERPKRRAKTTKDLTHAANTKQPAKNQTTRKKIRNGVEKWQI